MTVPSASRSPLADSAAGDPLEQALARALAAGSTEEQAALETWLKLRDLLRAKRPEAALSVWERWQADREAEVPAGQLGSEDPQFSAALPRTASEVLALLIDPGLPAHLRALAGVKRWQTVDEAAAGLAGALEHPLTCAEAHNLLGVLAAEAGQPERAAEAFAQALAADPGHYRALTNRAGLAAERGEHQQAESDLRRALELNPDHHAAHQNLAVILRKQGKRGEAVKALKRAQRLDYRQANARSDDQARRELASLPRIPRTAWIILGLVLFFLWLWLSSGQSA